MGLLGAIVGALIPLPGATIGFSIFFSFIGYAAARWGTGAVLEIIQRWIEDESEGDLPPWCLRINLSTGRMNPLFLRPFKFLICIATQASLLSIH